MIENNQNISKYSIKRLRSSWFDLLHKYSADIKLGKQVFNSLINSYSHKARSYHNLEHIDDILAWLNRVQDNTKNINVLQFSAWFHDYIYNPQDQDNEVKSAVVAKKLLQQLNVDLQTIKAVEQIILSTKYHQPLIGGIDQLFFLDIDLAILGAPIPKYQKYSQAIRQEYNHLSDKPEGVASLSDYQVGRTKVLNKFLARERIYYTDYFYYQLESIARENIQLEINYLSSI